jgi:hypothetical protein
MDYFTIPRERPASLTTLSQKVSANVPDDTLSAVDSIFMDGLKCMYWPDLLVAVLHERFEGEPLKMAIEGVAEVIERLIDESGTTLPMMPALYASQLLICEWLDFLDRSEMIKMTQGRLDEATRALAERVIPSFGITKGDRGLYGRTLEYFLRTPYLH